jgi:hypothetical protein
MRNRGKRASPALKATRPIRQARILAMKHYHEGAAPFCFPFSAPALASTSMASSSVLVEEEMAVVASGELCATLPTAAACAASAFFLRSTYALRLSFFLTGCGGLGAAVGDASGRPLGMLGVSGDCSCVGDAPAVADAGVVSARPEVATETAVTGLWRAPGVAGGGGRDGVGLCVGD